VSEHRISYRDYLISVAASTAGALTDGIDMAIHMEDEAFAVNHLEQKIAVARELLRNSPNPERVMPWSESTPTEGEPA
jgi:hypothetical protein